MNVGIEQYPRLRAILFNVVVWFAKSAEKFIQSEIPRNTEATSVPDHVREKCWRGIKMEWLQVITIIFSLAGLFYWFRMDLKSDISRLDTDMKGIRNDITADMRAQTARTDKLYEMFIQLQQENNDLIRALSKGKLRTDP